MNRIVVILTIIGGHFAARQRLLGLGFLALLAIAPFMATLPLALVPTQQLSPSVAQLLVAATYLVIVSLIWLWSAWTAVRYLERKGTSAGRVIGIRWLEVFAAGILAWCAIGLGLVLTIFGPSGSSVDARRVPSRLETEIVGGTTQSPDVQYRKLPTADGSILLMCGVERGGKPLAGEKARLIFAGGYASEYFYTDEQGQFTVRLPAGTWRLVGPDLTSYKENEIRYEILDSKRGDRTFVATVGPVSEEIRVKFWVE